MCDQVGDALVCRDLGGEGVAWWDIGGGVVWQFPVGNAAEWATAVIAAVALVFAAKAWRASQDQANLTRAALKFEVEREAQRRRDEEAAFQAILVAAWFEQSVDVVVGSEPVYSATIEFLNTSPLPVSDVVVTLAGQHPISAAKLKPGSMSREAPVHKGPGEVELTLQFTDVAGRRWTRHPDGRLTKTEPISGQVKLDA